MGVHTPRYAPAQSYCIRDERREENTKRIGKRKDREGGGLRKPRLLSRILSQSLFAASHVEDREKGEKQEEGHTKKRGSSQATMAKTKTSPPEIVSDQSAHLSPSTTAGNMQSHNGTASRWMRSYTWAVDKMRVIFIQNAGFVAAFSPFRCESVMLAAFRTTDTVNEIELTTAKSCQAIKEWGDQFSHFIFFYWNTACTYIIVNISFLKSKVCSALGMLPAVDVWIFYYDTRLNFNPVIWYYVLGNYRPIMSSKALCLIRSRLMI